MMGSVRSAVMGLFLVLLCLPGGVAGEEPFEPAARFERIDRDQGLSHFTVRQVLEDRAGFLWFATNGGLDRYDGHEFRHFRHDPRGPASISANRISALTESRDGRLWIGTEGEGVDILDLETETVTHLCLDTDGMVGDEFRRVATIVEDSRSMIWIGTLGGVFRFEPGRECARFFEMGDAVFAVHEDDSGIIWIGGEGGLVRYDPTTGERRDFAVGSVRAVIGDGSGGLWVGTADRGLMHAPSARDAEFWNLKIGPGGTGVHALWLQSTGRLWIGTDRGLCAWTSETSRLDTFRHDAFDRYSLPYDNVLHVSQDSSGMLWVGTWGGGVCKLDLRALELSRLRRGVLGFDGVGGQPEVMALIEDRYGALWIGTWDGGLHRLDRGAERFVSYRGDPTGRRGPTSDSIVAFLEDRGGRLWVGTRAGGLNRFDRETGRFVAYPQYEDPLAPGHLIHAIHEDRDGVLWLGASRGGLTRFDPGTGAFRHFVHDSSDPASIASDDVWSILEDESGLLWLATTAGLVVYDRRSDRFTTHSHETGDPSTIPNDRVTCLLRDRDGVVWVGTEGGLARTVGPPSSFRFETMCDQQGLSGGEVTSLIEGDDGSLWVGSTWGLVRLDPRDGACRVFRARSGAQDNYFDNSVARSADGRLFFGGFDGITVVDPKTVPEALPAPRTVLTEFLLLNRPQRPEAGSGHSPLASPVHLSDSISLRHGQFPLAFDFAALQYADTNRHRFAYRLEGLDADWVFTDARNRRATYSQLPPGRYTFRVRGANADGLWDETGAAIGVRILPPWWMTHWARIVGAVLFMVVLTVWHRLRVRRLKLQAAVLGDQVRKRTAELLEANSRLERLARTDVLTGLPNRRGFFDRAGQEFVIAVRTGRPMVLGMGDLDHFKNVNDNHGHEAGDHVLQAVTGLIRECMRERDVLARWGGEEFLFLLPDTDLEGGRVLAEKIRKRILAVPVIHGDRRIDVSITIGVAAFAPGSEPDAVIACADRALYRGKRAGRNRVVADGRHR